MGDATGFFTLFSREINRFMKIAKQTILAPLISSLLFILVFGVFIGSQISSINGVSYIEFLVPGLVMMGLITNAQANTSASLLMAKIFKHMDELLTSPLSYFQISLAYALAGVVRGLIVGFVTLGVALLFTPIAIFDPLIFTFFMFFSALLFSCVGMIIGLWAEKFDHITAFTNFLITPLVFFGGVFYSLSSLPESLRIISAFNPLFYMIDGFRYSMLGISDLSLPFSMGLVFVLSIVFFYWTVRLFKKGYKIRT